MCALLPVNDVETVVGSAVRVVAESSSEGVCTFRADARGLDVALRLEDSLPTLDSVAQTFTGSVESIADGGYWAPEVGTLWFTRGGQMYAVQVIGNAEPDEARSLALRLAQLATITSSPSN
jgi:hypothetical protein